MSEQATRRNGLLLAGLTAVISGFAVFINGYGVRAWRDVADPATYTTAKNLVAATVLVAVASILAMRRSSEQPRRPRGPVQWLGLSIVAVIGGSVPFVLFFEGLAVAESAQAAIIHKTLFVWVAILAAALLGERVGVMQLGALGALLVGQAVLLGGSVDIYIGVGEAMILAATLLWSVEVVLAKRLLRDLPGSTLAIVRMAGGAVFLIVFAVLRGSSLDFAALGWSHIVWVAATGVVLAGYVGSWFLALSRAPAVDVTAVLVGGAVITALLRSGVQGLPLPDPLGLGLLATGAGVIVVMGRRRVPAP